MWADDLESGTKLNSDLKTWKSRLRHDGIQLETCGASRVALVKPSSRHSIPVLSKSSQYALRALTWIASQRDGRHHLVREMALALQIPAPFLGKVLQPLVARGILTSQRGRSGGFRLVRAPTAVALIDIVETEETLTPADTCMLGQKHCRDEQPCPLHEYWMLAAAAFHTQLRSTTLHDLVQFQEQHPNCSYPLQSRGASIVEFAEPASSRARSARSKSTELSAEG